MIKKVISTHTKKNKHWVGDGFHVYGLLRTSEKINSVISPFILIDYASPKEFSKSFIPKGVGEHPHRGFETVTLAYQGEIQHRDSSGGGGIIKEGDVQWMTAGRGVVHDEFHSEEFTKNGGIFEMVQLWINLPKKHKMTDPKYQSIKKVDIPVIKISDEVDMRLIAGEYLNVKGSISTFTNINVMDLFGNKKSKLSINLSEGTNTILLVLSGTIDIEDQNYEEKTVLIFDQKGTSIEFNTSHNFKALLLNGEPINEPIACHGPFVMNTMQELEEAVSDYEKGKMGNIIL